MLIASTFPFIQTCRANLVRALSGSADIAVLAALLLDGHSGCLTLLTEEVGRLEA